MTTADATTAIGGGLLIGLAAGGMFLVEGRVAGVSGILGGLLRRGGAARAHRLGFAAGLVAGGLLMVLLRPEMFGASPRPLALVGLAGLLVGAGARLGGGCTSGHGVCGMGSQSPRSLVATMTFMATGALTVLLLGPSWEAP